MGKLRVEGGGGKMVLGGCVCGGDGFLNDGGSLGRETMPGVKDCFYGRELFFFFQA